MKIGLENSGQPRQRTSANFPPKKFVLVWQYSVWRVLENVRGDPSFSLAVGDGIGVDLATSVEYCSIEDSNGTQPTFQNTHGATPTHFSPPEYWAPPYMFMRSRLGYWL